MLSENHALVVNSPLYITLSVGPTANAYFEINATRKPKKTVRDLIVTVTTIDKK
jgi:hypothetical protein